MKTLSEQFDKVREDLDDQISDLLKEATQKVMKRVIDYSPSPWGTLRTGKYSKGHYITNHSVEVDGIESKVSGIEEILGSVSRRSISSERTKNLRIPKRIKVTPNSKIRIFNPTPYTIHIETFGWHKDADEERTQEVGVETTEINVWPGASKPPYKTYHRAEHDFSSFDLERLIKKYENKKPIKI